MKKSFLMLLGLAVMAIACEDPIKEPDSVTVNGPAEVTVAQAGEAVSVAFNANTAWTASISNKDFASINPTSGEAGSCTIKVTFLKNDSDDPRTADLTISAGTASAKVAFTQLAAETLSLPETEAEVDASEQEIVIKVLANVDYQATSDCDWLTVGATKGAVESQIHVGVAANTGEAREGVITVAGAGKTAEFTVKQAAFEPVFEIEGVDESGCLYVGREGGQASFTITTNCTYTIKKYDGEDEAFPWAPVTIDEENGTVTFNAEANGTYYTRSAYVKITVNEYIVPVLDENGDPTGETEPLTVRIYLYQAGVDYTNYSISMYDMEFDTWGTTVMSTAVYNGKHYVSNGQDLYEIDPATGSFKTIEWFCGNGMTQKVISNDDAGNLIVCNHTAYDGSEYLDGYFILNAVNPAGEEKNIITKAAWECGGPFGAKIAVRGDIFGDALIAGTVEGIADITMCNFIGTWEVSAGVAGDYAQTYIEGMAATWGTGSWNTYPNNCPSVVPVSTTRDAGYIVSGSYEGNTTYLVSADGTAAAILTPDPDQSDNYAYQAVHAMEIGGKRYLASVASTFFPAWGLTPVVSLVDLDSFTPGESVHTTSFFNANGASYFAPDWDYGISPACDVKLYDAGQGKVGVVYADLNGRCVESYAIDPAL